MFTQQSIYHIFSQAGCHDEETHDKFVSIRVVICCYACLHSLRCDIEAGGPRIRAEADRVVDAGDLTVSPGFINIHNHCEKGLLKFPDGEQVMRQGIITLVGGLCGGSVVDMGAALRQLNRLPLLIRDYFFLDAKSTSML